MSIYFESYGCVANQNNSEIMKGLLEQAGFIVVNNSKIADLAVLNTCIVKGPTEKRMIARIQKLAKDFQFLIVAGCMPNVMSQKIKETARKANPKIKISLIGVHNSKEIVRVAREILDGKETNFTDKDREVKLCLPKSRNSKVIGISQISEGCLGNCAYCIVKLVKGKLFSYPKEKIIENIKQDLKAGCKEIWITSQDNADYGSDRGKSELPELLQQILNSRSRFFLRIGMMDPFSLMPIVNEMVECYKDKKVFKFLHLPVQSGSDRVLKLMNRPYKVKDFLKIVDKFRSEIPDLTLSTDIIVGFPNETEEDFKETLELLEKVRPDVINISKFWPMPGTEAAEMKNRVDVKETKKRATELMELHKRIALENNNEYLGRIVKVFVDTRGFEDSWLARTPGYRLVVVRSEENLLGRSVDVKIAKATGHYLIGEMNGK